MDGALHPTGDFLPIHRGESLRICLAVGPETQGYLSSWSQEENVTSRPSPPRARNRRKAGTNAKLVKLTRNGFTTRVRDMLKVKLGTKRTPSET